MLNTYPADLRSDLDELAIAGAPDLRLPLAQTTSLVIALSLGLWTVIGYTVHVLVW